MTPRPRREIVDLAYAMLARVALQGRRFVAVDTDSMQMETALNHVHAARRFFGLESTRESMKLFADMLRKKGGYDPEELKALHDWVVNVKFKGPHLHRLRGHHPAPAATSTPPRTSKRPRLPRPTR